MPGEDTTREDERTIERARALVERYARRSPEFASGAEEHCSAAGDLIADVLAYVASLPESAIPPAYAEGAIRRLASAAARGVRNALAALTEARADGYGEDVAPDAIAVAIDAFCAYLRAA